jgi:Uma2 family endonuclease
MAHGPLRRRTRTGAPKPDECYVFGDVREPERPDLAIEVVWSPRGLDTLEIYRKLGVREVWYWPRRGGLTVHALRGERYEEIPRSIVLPDLDLPELVGFLDRPTASRAIREYRTHLQAGR